MNTKNIIMIMAGAMLGMISQPALSYGMEQEKKGQEAPNEEEEFVYGKSDYVPQNLPSAIIATPRYPMSNAASKVVTVVDRYLYDESKYSPTVIVSRLPDGVQDTSTPEKTMFSRTTAMINGDFDLYSSYWDKESLAFSTREFAARKMTPEKMIGNWQGSFRQLNMVMLRRIDFGDYVVLVYDLEQKQGAKEKLGMELPVIFQKEGQEWRATQALHEDDLVVTSPWVSGDHKIEVTVR